MSLAPKIQVRYGLTDMSALLDPILVEANVVDYLHGHADEAEIQVEDTKGVIRAGGAFWPKKGDDLLINLGFDGGAMYSAGFFTLDEAQVDGPPWTVKIRAMGASIKRPWRQKNSRGFEQQTLEQIAQAIGKDMGLGQVRVDPDVAAISFQRITQAATGGIPFLDQLAWKHGGVLKSLSDSGFHIVSLAAMLDNAAVALITPEDIVVGGLSLRSKTSNAPRAAVARYFHPGDKAILGQLTEPRERQVLRAEPFPGGDTANGPSRSWIGADRAGEQSVLKLMERMEDRHQADLRAQVALLHAQMGQLEGTIRMAWHPEVRSGLNVYLQGFGAALDGMYIVSRCEHRGGHGGYETIIDVSANPKGGKPPKKVVVKK